MALLLWEKDSNYPKSCSGCMDCITHGHKLIVMYEAAYMMDAVIALKL